MLCYIVSSTLCKTHRSQQTHVPVTVTYNIVSGTGNNKAEKAIVFQYYGSFTGHN